ncbi:uncharacterized protein LOC142340526 [Convolutriloba macropyga]|uniref:uncharacterized protein LOC142340526 n=1 Tax=Convolutriloba macropyga TaxID=536237 RepID=UPI003F525E51
MEGGENISIPGSLEYQTQILEQSSTGESEEISDERLQSVFKLLSQLIPQMGVHKQLFQLIYSELYKSVFSCELSVATAPVSTANKWLTSAVGNTAAIGEVDAGSIQHQSYFTLYKNIIRSRDEKSESLESYIGSLQDSLTEKENALEGCNNQIIELTEEVTKLNKEKADLEQKLVELTNTITKLDTSFKDFVTQKDISDLHYEDEILNLQNDLSATSMEVERMDKFEKLFKDLDEDFIAEEMQINKMPAQIVPASNKNSVLVDLKSCRALERQLLTVQNSLIEEFDQHMEKYREKMESANLAKNFRDPDFDKDEKMLAEIDVELSDKQRVFRRTIEDVEDELEMLRIHRENLEINRDRIKQEEEEKARDMATKEANKDKEKRALNVAGVGPNKDGAGTDADLTAGQKEAMETVFDKLEAQEQITSKYSSIIYFSNNKGRTFYELPHNSLCNSCGTTTMICPHKVARQDWVIELPPNTQLLRISRPKLKLQKKLDDREIEALFSKQLKQAAAQQQGPAKESTSAEGALGQSGKTTEGELGRADAQKPGDVEKGLSPDPSNLPSAAGGGGLSGVASGAAGGGVSEAEIEDLKDDALYFSRIKDIQQGLIPITDKLEGQFELIWKDFRQRTGGSLRLIPRHISEERVVSIVEQFLAHVLWQDRSLDTENTPSIVDSLYVFFVERYLLAKMAHYTLFDFLTSLQHFSSKNIVLLTFVQCLAGELDFSSLRTLIYLGQLVKAVQWNSLDDLYWFLHVAFQFLPSEECDNFVLDYVSFSKNSLSGELVMHFLFYLTLKHKDPRISHSEIRLCQFPAVEAGVMSEMEYAIALNDMVHMHSTQLRQRLFTQAAKAAIQRAKLLEGQSDPSGNTTALLTGDASVAAVASGGKSVLFETLVHITAYLELLDSFETAKRMFAQQDRNDRQAEYPKGLKIKVVSNKNPIIAADVLLKMAGNFSQRERSRVMRNMQASIDKATGSRK